MAFLRTLFHGAAEGPAPSDDFWWIREPERSGSFGVPVTAATALQVSTVFACRKVIAETCAMLPLVVFRRTGARAREHAHDDPVYQLLRVRPNGWQTPFDFVEVMTGRAALHGNAVALKQMTATRTQVEALLPVPPSALRLELLRDRGEMRYWIRGADGQERPHVAGEVVHLRGHSINDDVGADISQQAREAIGLARAMEMFGGRFFANDTTVGVIFEHPGALTVDARRHLTESLRDRHGGVLNAHHPVILEEGMKAQRFTARAGEDAQLTESRAAQVIEICRYFRMPPHKVQHLLHATFSNIEHQGIEFATDTIQPWATRWEQTVDRDLIVDTAGYYAKVVMQALMRGDSLQRSTFYRSMMHISALSPNEIRELEDLNPRPGGDRYYLQSAMAPLHEDGSLDLSAHGSTQGAAEVARASAPARAVTAFVADAADRIAAAEARAVARAPRDAAALAAWAAEFYGTAHRDYIMRVLAPFEASGAIDTAGALLTLVSEGQRWAVARGDTAVREQQIRAALDGARVLADVTGGAIT